VIHPPPLPLPAQLCTVLNCDVGHQVDQVAGVLGRLVAVALQLAGVLEPLQLVVCVTLGCLWLVTVMWLNSGGGPGATA
jgi:hypothetical protein